MLAKEPIQCMNPHAENIKLKTEFTTVFSNFLDSKNYILGDLVTSFESRFSSYIGTEYALGVGSGTDALILSLKALGIKTGDEVITTSHTALATIASITAVGATPVLIDINPDTYNINSELISKAITGNTKCIIAVHLYGLTCELNNIKNICKDNDLYLIEDCAQACGAQYNNKKVGSIGDIGCFSFYPTKNLGALGDAGAITVNNSDIYLELKQLRQYGWNETRLSNRTGLNSRLDELQAGFLLVKLEKLNQYNSHRIEIAKTYSEILKDSDNIKLPKILDDGSHVYHLFVIQHKNRDNLMDRLNKNSIMTGIHYPIPCHKQPGYKNLIKHGNLNITENICSQIISLPIFTELSLNSVREIATIIKKEANLIG